MSADARTNYARASLDKHATNRLKYPLSVMAAAVGTTADELKKTLDPEYVGGGRRKPKADKLDDLRDGASPDDYRARAREIPEDTRSPAARLFGDPIPGDTRRQRYGSDYSARAGFAEMAPAGGYGF